MVGAAIFVPVGLLETIAHQLGEIEVEEVTNAQAWALLGFAVLTTVTALLGEVFFAGVVAAAVAETHGGHAPSLSELVRSLPYGTLIAIDVLFALGLTLTLLVLVVPGVIFFGWFALAAPAAKIEHLGVRAGFARSRELSRGNMGLILALLVPVAIAGQFLTTGIAQGAQALIGETFGAEWLGATLSEFLAVPIWAFAAVALTYELREAGGD